MVFRDLLASLVSGLWTSVPGSFGMWCSTCQRDVPGLGLAGNGRELRCGKCGSELAASSPPTPTRDRTTATAVENITLEKALQSGPLSEDWALEAELRGVERLVSSLKARGSTIDPPNVSRGPHSLRRAPTAWEATDDVQPPTARLSKSPEPRSHTLAWLLLSLGLAVFACGGVLLGWSLIGRRDDLWPVGMPLVLIGQAGLVLGLVLQLDGLWNSSRKTAQVLHELDDELKNVRQATSLLTTSHSSGAQSFYLHLAEGASPQMLLADLKGQMDLLAQHMARIKN
jgi:hypothetical protein